MLLQLLKFLAKRPIADTKMHSHASRCTNLSKDIAVVAGRDGLFLINRHDTYIGRSLAVYGEYAGIEGHFLHSLVQQGQTVIEVGANIGPHTVGLAKQVGPSGKVFAFEPQRACFALLQSQLALNQLHNVVAFNEGVGAIADDLWLPRIDYAREGNFGGVSLQESGSPRQDKVNIRRLDDLFPDAMVHLLKIDVEGMEREVIEGARTLIERCKPHLYVENDRTDKSSALISLIRDHGYRLWWHIPGLFNPDNFFNISQNIFGNLSSFNMLCVHSSSPKKVDGLAEIDPLADKHPLAV